MKILYGKFDSDKALVTCHAHSDRETVYMYEITITDKASEYVSCLHLKRMDEGSFELIVELVKRGRHPKQVKRTLLYILERNLVKTIGSKIILKNKEALKENIQAYLSRKCQVVGSEKVSDFYKKDVMDMVLDIMAGSTLK